MTNYNFHNKQIHSPNSPPVLEKIKNIYKIWLPMCRNLPKSERYNIGQKIDSLLIEILEILHQASFSQIQAKISLLGKVLIKIDSLRFFVQLSWELKLLPNNSFATIGQEIEEVGKMVGGWRRGLLSKTATNNPLNEQK